MKNDKNIPPDTLEESNAPVLASEMERLHAQTQDMQMGIDILKSCKTCQELSRPKSRKISKKPYKNRHSKAGRRVQTATELE